MADDEVYQYYETDEEEIKEFVNTMQGRSLLDPRNYAFEFGDEPQSTILSYNIVSLCQDCSYTYISPS